jgi:hypothetical protein
MECDVADHSQLWLRMSDRDQIHGPTSLEKIVAQLHEKLKITHVVQADLLAASPGEKQPHYVVFTVTEIARSDREILGRQVAKVEIEFFD